MSFPENLPNPIKAWLTRQNFESLMPIQDLCGRRSIEESQLLLSSPTGSGKTLAFLIPAVRSLLANSANKVLILSPSPDLAMQNIKVLRDIMPEIGTCALIGGVSLDRQKQQLKKEPRFISATPGRLRDFMVKGLIKPSEFKFLIIDEIDALLREGIENLIAELFKLMPAEKHECIAASASLSEKTVDLLESWRPEFFLIKNKDATQIQHSYVFTNPNRRDITVIKLIRKEHIKKAIIFVNNFEHTRHILKFFQKEKLKANFLEAEISKVARTQRIKDFREGKLNFLITTDLLSRGFDCKDTAVIHYHCPKTVESFNHRSGRTGRGSEEGYNYLVMTAPELHYLTRFSQKLKVEFTEIQLSKNSSSSASSKSDSSPKTKAKTKIPKKKKEVRAKIAKDDKKAEMKKKRKHSKRKGRPGAHKKRSED